MKKKIMASDFLNIDTANHLFYILETNEEYTLARINKFNLKIEPVRKKTGSTILNSLANALSSSMGNGQELVNIKLEIFFADKESTNIAFNSVPVTRGSMEYNELVRVAREVESILKSSTHS